MAEVTRIQGKELAQVADFYNATGYGGGVRTTDFVLAANVKGVFAGVVRLCEEGGVTVLRGMHVAPAFQRQGVGRMLLAHCVPYLDNGDAYCLPYAHLVAFYGEAGFEIAQPDALPAFLAARLAKYLAAGQRILAMRRPFRDGGVAA